MDEQEKNQKLNNSPKSPVPRSLKKLSGRRHLPNQPKVVSFKRKYGKATKSFDAWFRSNYGE